MAMPARPTTSGASFTHSGTSWAWCGTSFSGAKKIEAPQNSCMCSPTKSS
jgi:hypothetical protein